MSRIFINYRRQDSEGYVGRLYDHLCQHFSPDDIFMDVEGITPGQDFVEALETAISRCEAFIAIIGPGWLTAQDDYGRRRLDDTQDFVRLEIASALAQKKPVIPVLVGRAAMPTTPDLPGDIAMLARRQAIELRHQQFAGDTDRLVKAIKSVLPSAAPKPRSDSQAVARKTDALKQVANDLLNATHSPLYDHRTENRLFPVMGDGNPDARLLFIGEAPGKYEAAQGRVFVGPSGAVLDEMLKHIGLQRRDVYITNILLDYPPGGRDPLPQEIEFYAPFIDRIIQIIQPTVIATMGKFASQHILKKLNLPEHREKITQLRGKLIKTSMPYGEIHVVPLLHPASVLYSASQKEGLRQDFEKLRLFL